MGPGRLPSSKNNHYHSELRGAGQDQALSLSTDASIPDVPKGHPLIVRHPLRPSRPMLLWLCSGLVALFMALVVTPPADGDSAATPLVVAVSADIESADSEADLPALRAGYSMPRTVPVGAGYKRAFLGHSAIRPLTPPERPPRLA